MTRAVCRVKRGDDPEQREREQHRHGGTRHQRRHGAARARHPQPGRVLREVQRRNSHHRQRRHQHIRGAPRHRQPALHQDRHRDRHHQRPDPDRPDEEHRGGHQTDQHHPRRTRRQPPARQRPPARHHEQLRGDLREEARLQEAVDAVGARREQHEPHGCHRQRHPPTHAIEQVVRDQVDEAGLQRDRQRQQRVRGSIRVHPSERPRHHDQQVQTRRVVRHLAERRFTGGAVNEVPRALEHVDQHQVMGEVRGPPGRKQRWPRRGEHRHQTDGHDGGPSPDQLRRLRRVNAATKTDTRHRGHCRCAHRNERGHEGQTEPAEEIGDDNGGGKPHHQRHRQADGHGRARASAGSGRHERRTGL